MPFVPSSFLVALGSPVIVIRQFPSSSGPAKIPSLSDTSTPVFEPKEEIVEIKTLPFDDLENYAWAKTAIEHMYINRIISGKSETRFAPEDNVKREEFVKIIVNSFELLESKETNFEDVGGEWFKEYIERGFASGIINGVSDKKFGVGENITREDMMTIACRAIIGDGKSDYGTSGGFPDEADISDYAVEYVRYLKSNSLITGDENGCFRPKDFATRAEAAKFISSVLDALQQGGGLK